MNKDSISFNQKESIAFSISTVYHHQTENVKTKVKLLNFKHCDFNRNQIFVIKIGFNCERSNQIAKNKTVKTYFTSNYSYSYY